MKQLRMQISLGVNSKEWLLHNSLNLAPSESFISAAMNRVTPPCGLDMGKAHYGPITAGASPACAAPFSTGIVPRHQSMPYAPSESGGEWRKLFGRRDSSIAVNHPCCFEGKTYRRRDCCLTRLRPASPGLPSFLSFLRRGRKSSSSPSRWTPATSVEWPTKSPVCTAFLFTAPIQFGREGNLVRTRCAGGRI